MKYKILPLLLAVIVFASCSTSYKASQTPDDVYYSPAQPAVAKEETREDKKDKYEEYVSKEDDSYLRMKIRNRNRWQWIDDYEYWNDTRYYPYSYNYYHTNWNNWYVWNTWTSPYISVGYNNYCSCYCPSNNIKNGYYQYPVKTAGVTRPNLNTYSNTNYSNTNNSNSGGSILKKVFSAGNTYSNRNSDNSSGNSSSVDRSYSPSSSGSSGGKSSGSSGGVSRPGRN